MSRRKSKFRYRCAWCGRLGHNQRGCASARRSRVMRAYWDRARNTRRLLMGEPNPAGLVITAMDLISE